MKIKFFGAASEVTGSKHLIEANGKKILLDCGMFQGRRHEAERKNKKFHFNAKEIDSVILSHAHIDHSGLIPLLVKNGYTGEIHATHATRDLCASMLRDSAYIQEKDAEYIRQKQLYRNDPHDIEPLYNLQDAEDSLEQFCSHSYEKIFDVAEGVKVRLRDAGHVLGSSIVEIFVREGEIEKKIVFTGDLGRKDMPILRDPSQISEADFLITESTYGNRLHEKQENEEKKIIEAIERAFRHNGKIIIPAFALERTQELLYVLNKLLKEKKIPRIKVFVDSPLAIDLTTIFSNHPECFDLETRKIFLDDKENPFALGNIYYTRSVAESKSINFFREPAIIISASGMCEFGRIRHHLRNHISNPRNSILIVGYMAQHTLGRCLVEKKKEVKIFGEKHKVKAKVITLNGFSAHADRDDILQFTASFSKKPDKVFVVHGDPEQSAPLAETMKKEKMANEIFIPREIGEEFELG